MTTTPDSDPHVPAEALAPHPQQTHALHRQSPDSAPRTATRGPNPHSRALVLGGGGSTGNAWLIGVLAGLAEAGLGVTRPDRTIGTSAGATVAAQVAEARPVDLYESVLAEAVGGQTRRGAGGHRRASSRDVSDRLAQRRALIAESADLDDFRRRIAAQLLGEGLDDEWHERWRTIVASRFTAHDWPAHEVLLTAVDARTGEPVVLDARSGVDLVDAVAASCSSGRAYPIGERRLIDGGYRANTENADLAAGFSQVLVLSPLGGRSLHPPAWGTHLAAQIDALEASGSRVETLAPEAEHLFGTHAMDLTLRPAAARAGFDQGRSSAPRIAAFWG